MKRNYCSFFGVYKKAWVMRHFGYNATTPEGVCPSIPQAMKNKFATCTYIVPPRMSFAELQGIGDPPVSATPACSSQSAQNNFAGASARPINVPTWEPRESTGERSRIASNLERPSALRQQHMSEAYHIAKRRELNGMWANFFYEANVAFNIVRTHHLSPLCKQHC